MGKLTRMESDSSMDTSDQSDDDATGLAGMTVGHSKEAFLTGEEQILVLDDKEVLDESEDVLINPTLVYNEQLKRNRDKREKKSTYNPYDEEEVDDFGIVKRKEILSKYDDGMDGPRIRETFKLDERGGVDVNRETAELHQKRKEFMANKRFESLETPVHNIQNIFYTEEEMISFRKPKKKNNVTKSRKRKVLKADDLIPEPEMEKFEKRRAREEDVVFDPTSEDYKTIGNIPTMRLDENRDSAFQVKQLLLKLKKETEDEMEVDAEDGEKQLVLDAAFEDYKTIGNIHTFEVPVPSRLRKEAEEDVEADIDDYQKQIDSTKGFYKPIGNVSPIAPVVIQDLEEGELSDSGKPEKENYENFLGKEIDVTKGVAGMLKLAGEKGYLENPNAKRNRGGTLKHLESKLFAKVEFNQYDIEDKYLRKLERMGTTGSGPLRSFAEKRDYKPNVELTYTDAQGRDMDEKDAFKSLSHKFHGKAPGKKQIEKRMRQNDKKEKLKKMNSSDTPLGTLAKQIKKQEKLQTHYLLLSGGRNYPNAPLEKD